LSLSLLLGDYFLLIPSEKSAWTKLQAPTPKMTLERSLLWLTLVLAISSASVGATQYSVHAIWSLVGQDAAMQQWLSIAKYAASVATASWTSDSLSIDLLESKGNPVLKIQQAVAASQNNSVHALLGEDQDAAIWGAIASSNSLPLVSPNTISSYVDTAGLGVYSLLPRDGSRVDALRALLAKYSWTKIGVLYNENSAGLDVVELIRALPGLDRYEFGLDPLAPTYSEILDELFRLSINVLVVVDSEQQVAERLFAEAVDMQLVVAGRAWIFMNDVAALPSWLPQGVLAIHEVDATPTNLTLFEDLVHGLDSTTYPGCGPSAPIFGGSLLVYDSVFTIAAAIQSSFPAVATRTAINSSLAQTQRWGYSGFIEFNRDGFRKSSHVQLLAASNVSGTFDLCMAFELTLTTFQEPIWPGMTTATPDDQVDTIPIVLMLDFSGGHSTPFETQALLNAMRYAVYRMNDMPNFLPSNKRISPVLLDDQTKPSMAVLHSINVPLIGAAGVIGGMSSSISIVVQDVISAWKIPQISPSATAPQLSNKDLYPTFSRVCSSAKVEGDIIVELSKMYSWTELSIISTLDAYGSAAAQDLLTHSADAGIDIHEHLVVDPLLHDYDEPLQRMVKAEPRILVLLVGIESIANVVRSMHRVGLQAPATLATDSIVLTNITEFAQDIQVPADYFKGWVIFGQPGGTGSVYDDFVEELASLDQNVWPGVSRITGSSPVIVSCFDAVYVLADSIRRCVAMPASTCDPRNGTEMLPLIRSVDLVGLTGHLHLTPEGDRDGTFDIRNVRDNLQRTIGRFSTDIGLELYEPVVWPDGTTNVPLAVIPRIQQWIRWDSAAGIILSIVAAGGIALSLFCMLIIYWQRHSPVVTSATWQFLILMCCGAILGFGSVWVWIGRPQAYLCALRIWIPPVAFVVMLAPLLAKTWRLVRIFSLKDFRVEPIALSTLVLIVAMLTTVQVIICIFWISLGTVKAGVINDLHNAKHSYVVCETNRVNRIASYVTFGYNGLLILTGCYLAFRVRKLPKDFNESLWIVRAIYNTLLFAGLNIILGYSLSNWITTVTILICVCTLGICFGSVGLIMAPKVWELYVHPERRSSSSGDSTRYTTRRTIGTSAGRSKSSENGSKDYELNSVPPTSSVGKDHSSPGTQRRRTDYSRSSRNSKENPTSSIHNADGTV
jgi:ABC-type branched-subunit amino acid transport system substrate-binding protein